MPPNHPHRHRFLPALAAVLCAAPLAAQDTAAVARLHRAVLEASPELRASNAERALAQGRLAAAGFGAPLVLSAEAEDIDARHLADASVRLYAEKEFLPAGQAAAERAAAAAEVTTASVRLGAVRRLVLARADRALVRAAGNTAIAALLAENDALLSSAETSLRTRFGVGQGSYVDVLRLRTERLRVQTERAAALAEARAGRSALEALVPPGAEGRSATLALVDSLDAHAGARTLALFLPPAPEVDSLVEASAALRLADAALDRARAERALTLAAQKPRLSAFLGAQRFTGDTGGTVLGPVLGGSISLPFSARQANRAGLAAADLGVHAAEASRDARRATLRAELLGERERYRAALERIAVYDAALLQAAEQEREGALAAYRTGQLSLTDFLDFERGLSRAVTDRLQSQVEAADALARLFEAAWGVTEAPSTPEAP